MKITIIIVSSKKQQEYQLLYQSYQKRILHFHKNFEVVTIKDNSWAEQDKAKYYQIITQKIQQKIQQKDKVIYLDSSGKQYSSILFARKLEKVKNSSQNLTFVIGGSIGLPKEILQGCDVLSFSKMTFTHSMSLLLLLEQIFRAFNILNGGEYHK